jgi:hypothetical protein
MPTQTRAQLAAAKASASQSAPDEESHVQTINIVAERAVLPAGGMTDPSSGSSAGLPEARNARVRLPGTFVSAGGIGDPEETDTESSVDTIMDPPSTLVEEDCAWTTVPKRRNSNGSVNSNQNIRILDEYGVPLRDQSVVSGANSPVETGNRFAVLDDEGEPPSSSSDEDSDVDKKRSYVQRKGR